MLTVAVSVVAGVAAITSAVPALAPHAVALSLGFVVRADGRRTCAASRSPGARSRSRPTASCVAIYAMLARRLREGRLRRRAHGRERRTTSCARSRETGGLLTVFLVLRAFASGCTALTGVEAVSNGVPGVRAAEEPQRRDDAVIMGVLATTMFAGITALALLAHVHMAEDPSALIGLPPATSRRPRSARSALATFGQTRAVLPAAGRSPRRS